MDEAEDRIFGLVLMNDWSARDIQAWEYVPLGPFTAKNFMTTISPWIVSVDALAPFKCSTSTGEAQVDPTPLPYIQDPDYATSSWNIGLTVDIKPDGDDTSSTVSNSNLKYMYWNMKQQVTPLPVEDVHNPSSDSEPALLSPQTHKLVHHSVTGCSMNAGDLLGTGTISGTSEEMFGSMLELSWRGQREVDLAGDKKRKFLQDGDDVIMKGFAQGEGYRVGFGEVSGKVLPADTYD